MIVYLYKKHCNGDTCKLPTTAENFIMYKNREVKIWKSDKLEKSVIKEQTWSTKNLWIQMNLKVLR